MVDAAHKATIVGLVCNIFLFILKLVFGLLSNSIALISDAINSFTDIASSIGIFIAVKVGREKADYDHQFGHHRAEPIAAFVVAILAAVLGFEILKSAAERMIFKEAVSFGWPLIIVLLISMALKYGMSRYFRKVGKEVNSPAILATALDSKNDVYVSGAVLFGIIGGIVGYPITDPLAASFVGLRILQTAYIIGKENVDYLIGKSPPSEIIEHIKKNALGIGGVKGVHDVRAHYVGNFVHVEVHIELNKKLTTAKAHTICKKVQQSVASIPNINECFVHIDPV